MLRFRLCLSPLLLVVALLALDTAGHSQTPAASPRTILGGFGPSAIEQGIIPLETQAPDSPETKRRLTLRPATGFIDRAGVSAARYIPGRVIVKFKDGVAASSRVSTLSNVSRSASLSRRPTYADFDLVEIGANEDAESVARAFAEQGDVEYAQAVYRVRPRFKPNDTFYSEQWNLPIIDMERAWDIQPAAGSAITVAVLDTGVAYSTQTIRFHANAFSVDADGNVQSPPGGTGTLYPALGDLTLSFVAAPQLAPLSRFVFPHDFIWDDDLPVDLNGHGTHVSGTIGQLTNDGGGTAGVAFNVKIMPVKVVDTEWDVIFDSPNFGSDVTVARGIRYAVDNGAKVLNLSIGREGPPDCGTRPTTPGCAPVVEDAVRYAVSKGAFLAFAAGNEFEEGNPTEAFAEIASRVSGAVSVAAIDRSKNHAYYSNTGTWVELAAPGGSFRGFPNSGGILQQTLHPDFVETFLEPVARFTAPRFDVLAYVYYTGTSQATPHVSGVAAMLMQQGITNPAAVEAALAKFATDLGDPGRDPVFGYGLIEARNTLRGLGLTK
jgi:serine protease